MNTIKIDSLTYLIRTIQATDSLKRAIVETAHCDEKIHKALEKQKQNPKHELKQEEFDMSKFNPNEVETLVDRKSNKFKDNLAIKVDTTNLEDKQTNRTEEKNRKGREIE